MNKHREPHGSHGLPEDDPQLTLRNPADLADALPYLMGFHPTDSIVMVALHGRRGRFGGRLRLGIPRAPGEWPHVAEQLAECLVAGSERRGPRPDGIIVFLCQDPDPLGDTTAGHVMERLRPLAQLLRTACGALDVPVLEALCISDGRYWSYCCPDARCCPPEGNVLALPGTSVLAAAATFAGLQVRGSLREMEARLAPWRRPAAVDQERALAAEEAALVPRVLDEEERLRVGRNTLDLAGRVMRRLSGAPPATGRTDADALDDALITHEEAAALLLGLQDRTTRDRAAEWMEGPDAAPALRLWRALARRCVGRYGEHAAAPLTLAGWVAWSTGDEPAARVALGLALRADPDYQFAQLLHQACNQGLDPEALRRCLREERREREGAPLTEDGAVWAPGTPEPGRGADAGMARVYGAGASGWIPELGTGVEAGWEPGGGVPGSIARADAGAAPGNGPGSPGPGPGPGPFSGSVAGASSGAGAGAECGPGAAGSSAALGAGAEAVPASGPGAPVPVSSLDPDAAVPPRRFRPRRKASGKSPVNRKGGMPASTLPDGNGSTTAGSARRGARRISRTGRRDGTDQ